MNSQWSHRHSYRSAELTVAYRPWWLRGPMVPLSDEKTPVLEMHMIAGGPIFILGPRTLRAASEWSRDPPCLCKHYLSCIHVNEILHWVHDITFMISNFFWEDKNCSIKVTGKKKCIHASAVLYCVSGNSWHSNKMLCNYIDGYLIL